MWAWRRLLGPPGPDGSLSRLTSEVGVPKHEDEKKPEEERKPEHEEERKPKEERKPEHEDERKPEEESEPEHEEAEVVAWENPRLRGHLILQTSGEGGQCKNNSTVNVLARKPGVRNSVRSGGWALENYPGAKTPSFLSLHLYCIHISKVRCIATFCCSHTLSVASLY